MNPFTLTKRNIKRYRPIDAQTHRHPGHALIIAGSYGKIGAAVLASKGCLKLAGLVTALFLNVDTKLANGDP
jgi:NAD(P)H-hydrate repair Nnr-like enzyme with NAD(P)H-hydrate dehydratase domain